MSVFLKENFDKFQELIADIETVVILGKGPTYSKYDPDCNTPNTFIIGINDVVVDCYCDMIVANDKCPFKRISPESLDRVPYICLGAILQARGGNTPLSSRHWDFVLSEYKHSYVNKHVIPYQIGRGNPQLSQYIKLPSGITSSNNAFDLVNLFMPNVNHVNFYGVGMSDNNRYSDPFKGLPNCDESSYNNDRIDKIRNHIETTCRKNLTFQFN
jgi:hypothetical protein